MKTLIALFALVMLTGCGLHNFEAGDGILQVEMDKDAARVACYQAQSKPDYSKLSDMAIVMIEQQKATAQLVSALTGKSVDPCSGGTNLNDVLIADSNNRNESLRSITGTVAGVAKFGLGVWGATEVIDSIGKNAGSTSNVTTEGGDSTISNSRTNTETVTRVTNTGEEGTATTSGGYSETPVDTVVDEPIETSDETLTVSED